MSDRKVNPLTSAINESIRDKRDGARRYNEQAKALQEQRMLIRAKFSKMLKGFNTEKHYVGVSLSCDKPLLTLTMNSLDSFKDIDLAIVLAHLLDMGADIKEEEWPQYHNKDYRAELPDATVVVHAYVRSDSPTCRRVQVGTQLREEPVWELHCS